MHRGTPCKRKLEPIVGTYIYAGKKNEVISLQHIDANITEKTGRTIAKIPGIFVYDMEGGNQINISARGFILIVDGNSICEKMVSF